MDASNPLMDEQMYTVYETLQNLGVKDKPVITVFNKIDRMEDTWVPRDLRADYHVKISAKTGEGITGFLQSIEAVLRERKVEIEALYPYKEAGKIQKIRKYGELQEEEYREDGIFVRAFVLAELLDAHHVRIPDWGTCLHLKQMIDVDITHIGFRAHEFIPVWGEREDNCIPVKVKGKAEFPFEWKYFLKGETEESDDICWYVQKTLWAELEEKGIPDYLKLPEKEILLLK